MIKTQSGFQPTEEPAAFRRHVSFSSATLTGIGAGVGQPRNIISNDSSDYNYASGRLDHQTFFRYVETIQQRLIYILDEIFDYFTETSNDPGINPEFVGTIKKEWYFAELQHVDPLKEADASIKLLNARLLTRKEYFAKYSKYHPPKSIPCDHTVVARFFPKQAVPHCRHRYTHS